MGNKQPRVRVVESQLEAVRGGIVARCAMPGGRLPIAHLGCQHIRNSIKKVSGLPAIIREPLDRKYGSSWSKVGRAAECVTAAVAFAVVKAGLDGATLVDTLRFGCDYWRPGKLVTEVADSLRKRGLEMAYAREDALCPDAGVLDRFREDRSMGFAEFASAYEQKLLSDDRAGLRVAAFVAVKSLAMKLLPVYYCTDPYIPDYAPALHDDKTPFANRQYPEDPADYLRQRGCHRVVLTECLARFLASLGTSVSVYELDANRGISYHREWPGVSC
jgi:hypothetical protein